MANCSVSGVLGFGKRTAILLWDCLLASVSKFFLGLFKISLILLPFSYNLGFTGKPDLLVLLTGDFY